MAVEPDDYSTGDQHRAGLDHMGSADRDLLHGPDRTPPRSALLRVPGVAAVE